MISRFAVFLLLLLSSSPAQAAPVDGRAGSLQTATHCLQSLRSGDLSAALSDFALTEQAAPATRQQLAMFARSPAIVSNRGINAGSTGSSDAEFQGHSLLYLFGEVRTSTAEAHFTADAVLENGAWKLTRLFVDGAGTAGSDRFTYDKVPKVNNAVGSMIAGESVLNRFMRAGERGDLDAAIAAWTRAERGRPGKRDEITRLIATHSAYFKGFQQVDEGRTGFGFEGPGTNVQIVTAKGKMTFTGGVTRDYAATLVREDGQFHVQSLTLFQ